MIKHRIRQLGEAVGGDLSPVIYLVCIRAALLSAFLMADYPEDNYFDIFGEGTLIYSTTWGAVALSASLFAIIGTLLKNGTIVSTMTMSLFVLWLYLVVLYLANGNIALALVESTTLLLFAYFYVSVSINRTWSWVPHYVRSREAHPAGKGLTAKH